MIADYIKAENVIQALEALDSNQPMARILAGGTDIMQKTRAIRRKQANDIVFVDIKAIAELKGIRQEGDCLIIGPATTLEELIHNDMIAAQAPDLIQAAGYVGSLELRNRATVGGNICTKNPAADLLVPLLALGARVEVCDLNGRKEISLADLLRDGLRGFGRRTMITAVKIPSGQKAVTGYRRWTKASMGRAYLSVIVSLQPQADSCQLKVIMGGASLWPRSFDKVTSRESLLPGEERDTLVGQVVQEILGVADNDADAYRWQLARVLTDEALDIATKGVK